MRRHLRSGQGDELTFRISDSGAVELQVPTYPIAASLRGHVASLDRELGYDAMKEIAYDDLTG